MSSREEITYRVLTCENGQWQSKSTVKDMFKAKQMAEQLQSSRKCEHIKIDKTFFDKEHGRQVTMTIVDMAIDKNNTPLAVWLLLAVIGGMISFGATYLAMKFYL